MQFQTKYLNPLPNGRVEFFARCLARDAKYIRDPIEPKEFEKMVDEVRHSFREMAAEYATILGIDPMTEEGA